jgi:hypothetical protein
MHGRLGVLRGHVEPKTGCHRRVTICSNFLRVFEQYQPVVVGAWSEDC